MFRSLRQLTRPDRASNRSLLQYVKSNTTCRNATTHHRCFSATNRRHIMETTGFTENQMTVREAVSTLCAKFPNSYWQEHDQNEEDPKDFHAALAKDGWLGIALPETLGGSGLGISEATMMMQTIAESGAGMAGAQSIHANVYATQPLAKFGTLEQQQETIPRIISGEWRTCFGVTEPNTGLDTLRLRTTARKSSDGHSYSVTGQKIWITCAQVARKMMLLARTTPLEEVRKPSEGLSLFCIDLPDPSSREGSGLDMRNIKKMGGRAVDANEVFFDNYQIPADTMVGAENQGFKIILHGMNAERCLLAGEALGLGYAAVARAAGYARERVVFGRPIGANQGIAHPLADAYMRLEAAKLATYHAARLYDQSTAVEKEIAAGGDKSIGTIRQDAVGVAANSAKYLAAEAAFTACERAVLTHGGMGYAMEYDVERWLRECLVPRIAPVSREMIMNYIGEKVLGLPRSY
ncbi:acyl-CoA dehydrogenase/oxidase [Apiospora arundinis]